MIPTTTTTPVRGAAPDAPKTPTLILQVLPNALPVLQVLHMVKLGRHSALRAMLASQTPRVTHAFKESTATQTPDSNALTARQGATGLGKVWAMERLLLWADHLAQSVRLGRFPMQVVLAMLIAMYAMLESTPVLATLFALSVKLASTAILQERPYPCNVSNVLSANTPPPVPPSAKRVRTGRSRVKWASPPVISVSPGSIHPKLLLDTPLADSVPPERPPFNPSPTRPASLFLTTAQATPSA
mmetsp:Transcript_19829/g.39660  ORF Transcript_19829/g.39660 Transcript_19829/m.39660 type:complete len:243 (+) Transcript_19829:1481-2209(+)